MIWSEEEYNEYLKRTGQQPRPVRRNKYKNVKTNGYDSKHEAEKAAELHLMEKAGQVTVMEQIPFRLIDCKYIADFVLLYPNGKYEVLDAKGAKTKEYILKKKMLKKLWNIDIQEI